MEDIELGYEPKEGRKLSKYMNKLHIDEVDRIKQSKMLRGTITLLQK